MTDKLKLTNRLMRIKDRSQTFHSSGYAQAQNRGNFGAASTESFAERQKINENRKFVRGYNNARVISDAYAFERVRNYIPRTDNGSSVGNSGVAGASGVSRASGASRAGLSAAAKPSTPPTRRVSPIRPR